MIKAEFNPGSSASMIEDFYFEGEGERETLMVDGWPRLSRETNWLRPKTISVVAGPAGKGKSLFAIEVLIRLHYQGVKWEYLPLEDSAAEVYRRILAFLADDWKMLDTDKANADRRRQVAEDHTEIMAQMSQRVWENPRLQVGAKGEEEVPPLPHEDVIAWAQKATKRSRVVVIDPIAQIDWGGRDLVARQADFARRMVGMAAASACTVVIIGHTVKRPGKQSTFGLTQEDVQGASELTRLAHNVILWDSHEDKQTEVWRAGGEKEMVSHNRTLVVGKCRFGKGSGLALAYSTRREGPGFTELGVIAPQKRRG